MLCDDVWKSAVYVISPVDVIPIRRAPQSREQSKLQMVMRIHEARQKQETGQIDLCASRFGAGQSVRGTQNTGDAIANDFDRGMCSLFRSERASGSANDQLVLLLRIQVPTLHN
jgi:hypothetical protein